MFRLRKPPAVAPRRGVSKAGSRKERAANRSAREELADAFSSDFADVLAEWREGINLANVEAAVVGGNVQIVEEALDLGRLQGGIGAAIDDALTQAVARGADIGLRHGPEPVRGVSVNSVSEIAAGFIDGRAGEAVVEITDHTRAGVRRELFSVLSQNLTPTEAAARIGQTVGLTERQTGWVDSFREKLERRLIPTPEADTPAIRRAIDQQVEDYRDRLLRTRGQAIAQTEMQNAIQWGERAFWEVAVSEGEVERAAVSRRWFTVEIGVCPICIPMHGQVRGIDEDFSSSGGRGFLGRSPPAHVNCHCYLEWFVEE